LEIDARGPGAGRGYALALAPALMLMLMLMLIPKRVAQAQSDASRSRRGRSSSTLCGLPQQKTRSIEQQARPSITNQAPLVSKRYRFKAYS
jgi:hypothetical protein